MRRVIFFVATSLDGYIAGPDEEVDWLFHDQDYGFAEFLNSIDTVLMGRKTYDFMVRQGQDSYEGKRNYVFSCSDRDIDTPNVTWVTEEPAPFIRRLREEPGGDIWLVGGGRIFANLLQRGGVDELILAVHPLVLGEGIPLFPGRSLRVDLALRDAKVYDSGLVMLHYGVERDREDGNE